MWPIRKRDGGEGKGEQFVMKGVGRRKFRLTFQHLVHSGSLFSSQLSEKQIFVSVQVSLRG